MANIYNMKRIIFPIILALFAPFTISASEPIEGNKASSLFFGPNALPVPDMLDGTVSERFYAELSFDTFKGFYGDRTFDIFAKVHIPLFTPRVNLSVWMPVVECYHNTAASVAHQQPEEVRMKGHEFGNVYATTDIHVLQQRKYIPDITLRVGLITASGDSDQFGRYFDAPCYFVDTSIAKSVSLADLFVEEMRFVVNAGFLCWQVGRVTQNDAFLYGGMAKLGTRLFDASVAVQGYSGWIGNGDRPCVIKANVVFKVKHLRPLLAYQYGFRDYPFHQVRIGLGYSF